MPTALHHEGGDTYRLELTGRLEQADQTHAENDLAAALTKTGSIKLLCLLDGFEGFGNTKTSNLGFYARHGDQITRIAIVGKERWRNMSLMFAVADLRKAPVQFFPDGELEQARKWLAS